MDKRMIYAGIGSRETPEPICRTMYEIAGILARKGYTLRSGGAKGADQAFEFGCDDMVLGKKEIYLPWKGFMDNDSLLCPPTPAAYSEARRFHPNWIGLTESGRALMARNAHQVLGSNLLTPVDFILFWTKDGKASGGTGQALRMAKHYEIPTCWVGRQDWTAML